MSSEEAVCLPQSKRKDHTSLSTAYIEEQAKEFSTHLFVGVKAILQRTYDEAEAQIASYQDAANKEIAETETLINALQERNILLLKDNQALQDALVQAKETEYTLQKNIQTEAQEKLELHEDKRVLQAQIDTLKHEISVSQTNIERLNTYNQTIQSEHNTQLSDVHQQHIDKINELHDFFEASMQSAKEIHQKEMDRKTRLHQEEVERRETELQQRLQQANQERTKLINDNIQIQKEMGDTRASHAETIQTLHDAFDRKWDEVSLHSKTTIQSLQSETSQLKHQIEQLQQTLSQERLSFERDAETSSRESKIKIEGLEFLLSQERNAHAQEKQDILRQSQFKIDKAEQLLSLEKDDKKNILVKAEQDIHAQREALSKNMKHSAMNYINKEKAALISQHETSMATLKKSFDNHIAAVKSDAAQKMQLLESKLQTLPQTSDRERQLEKELSVMAEKKFTVEMHFKKLQKEVIELKKIITSLRQQQKTLL